MGEINSIEFDAWLKETLIKLNTDDEVFSPYIKGIMDTDDPIEEKTEALEGILASIIVSVNLCYKNRCVFLSINLSQPFSNYIEKKIDLKICIKWNNILWSRKCIQNFNT